MNQEAWDKIRPIILSLVKRKNTLFQDIGTINQGYNRTVCICNLCYESMPQNSIEDIMNVRKHFFNHLKEYNLLPFL